MTHSLTHSPTHSLRTRTSDDLRATVYSAANVAFDITTIDDVLVEDYGRGEVQRAHTETVGGTLTLPRGVRAYASLSAHCHAVARVANLAGQSECRAHDEHVEALQRWGAVDLAGRDRASRNAYRAARWLLAVNGGTFGPAGMTAGDVLQETILKLLEHGERATLERVLAVAGVILARIVDDADAAGEDWEAFAGARVPLEWLD